MQTWSFAILTNKIFHSGAGSVYESAAYHTFNSCARITPLFFDKNYNQAMLFLNLQTILPPNIMIEIMSKFIFILFPFKGKALFSQFWWDCFFCVSRLSTDKY